MPGRSVSSSVSPVRPGEIAAREQLLQPAAERRVDGLRFLGQLPSSKIAEDEAVHRECRQALGPDLEMHSTLL